jgi:hypothetical protein
MRNQPSSTKPKNAPIHHIRAGALSASIWLQDTAKGPMYNVTFQRSYREGADWKTSNSFGRDQLLVLSHISIGQLREGHGQELIPTREVTNAVVALVAADATAKLLAVHPIHDLTENRLFRAHSGILASAVLRKNAKQRRNRSHPTYCVNRSFSTSFNSQQFD